MPGNINPYHSHTHIHTQHSLPLPPPPLPASTEETGPKPIDGLTQPRATWGRVWGGSVQGKTPAGSTHREPRSQCQQTSGMQTRLAPSAEPPLPTCGQYGSESASLLQHTWVACLLTPYVSLWFLLLLWNRSISLLANRANTPKA